MTLKLSRRTKEALGIIRHTARTNIVEMAKEIDADPQTFFENEDWSGLDLRECDVTGVSFRGANLDGVQVYRDQWDRILVTVPASYRGVEPELRPEKKPFPSEAAREAYAEAERLIEEARQKGAKALYLRGFLGNSKREGLDALDRLPPQISTLLSLQSLGLSNTQVSDLAPLGGLTSLQKLNLDGTQVSDLATLGWLTSLQSLDLSMTQVSDIAPLGGLTSLQILNLNQIQVSDLAPLGGLTSLQILDLDRTQVSDLAPLSGLTALQRLYLSDTQVSDLARLGGLTALKFLYLQNTPVKDLSPIQHLIEDGLTVYGK